MVVSTAGNYQITSQSRLELFGILYAGQFNPLSTNSNLLMFNGDGGSRSQFSLSSYLNSTNYVIVVTTYYPIVTGSYSILVQGPATVTLQ
jgi:hypothetical protein